MFSPIEHLMTWAARFFPTREEAIAFADWYLAFAQEYPDVVGRRSYTELLPIYERRQ